MTVAVVQVFLVLGFADFRQAAVSLGTEVVLQTAPVDPRDLFRGDYVILSYEISTPEFCPLGEGRTGYLPLVEGDDGVWREASPIVWPDYESAAERGDAVIRGRASGGDGLGSCRMEYGIESYFVPEGTGRRIERLSGQLRVRVSVSGDGAAVIDELVFPGS